MLEGHLAFQVPPRFSNSGGERFKLRDRAWRVDAGDTVTSLGLRYLDVVGAGPPYATTKPLATTTWSWVIVLSDQFPFNETNAILVMAS